MQEGKVIVQRGFTNIQGKKRREKEGYTQLNAEFQRRARRDKKAFLSEQCEEIKENDRMGKTRDLFKKIGDIKGVFHAKMGTIKDRNSKDLTEGEDIKKRWQENTEEPYEKCISKQDNDNSVVSHLEPDILECDVKKVLGSIIVNKAGDGIPAELFKILKDAFNVLANLKHSAAVAGLENVSFHFNPKEEQCQRMFKLPYNCSHFTS